MVFSSSYFDRSERLLKRFIVERLLYRSIPYRLVRIHGQVNYVYVHKVCTVLPETYGLAMYNLLLNHKIIKA